MRLLAPLLLALAAASFPATALPEPAPASPARESTGMFGRWWGRYVYQDPSRPIVTFTVRLDPTAPGKFAGTAEEDVSDFGPSAVRRLHATVHGTFDAARSEVRFLKVYDFDPARQVEYRGTLSGDEVSGTWTIPGTSYSGTFFLRRAPEKKPRPQLPPPR
jgi:hypothetical protein